MESPSIQDLLKEVSFPYRLKIIDFLKDELKGGKGAINLSELHKRLKANGVKIPVSTVYRAVNNLSAAGILDKKDGEVSLTPAGISRLRGAVYSLIFSERVINEKISTILQAFKELRLRDEEIKISQSRVEYRVLDTPIQLGLMDRKLGIIILSRGVLSPFFVLEEKRKILWLESVFEYYWDIAKPLTEYIEKGKGDLKEKIFGSLQRF